MPNIGPLELIVVLVVALLILGPKKLPDVGRSVGRGIREFKGSLGGDDDAAREAPELAVVREPAAPVHVTAPEHAAATEHAAAPERTRDAEPVLSSPRAE